MLILGGWAFSYERGTPVAPHPGAVRVLNGQPTLPPALRVGSNRSFSIALICNTSRKNPASASTKQGPEKDDLIQLWGLVVRSQSKAGTRTVHRVVLQGYLVHKKPPPPLGPPYGPRHRPTVGFGGVAFFCKQGTSVGWSNDCNHLAVIVSLGELSILFGTHCDSNQGKISK